MVDDPILDDPVDFADIVGLRCLFGSDEQGRQVFMTVQGVAKFVVLLLAYYS
jgi:hypothetical protein